MNMATAMSAIQTISILIGVIVACGTLLSRQNSKVSDLTEMRTDIKYIKDIVRKIEPMSEKLVEVEASAKQAHKRLDEHIASHNKRA